ncbi:MAG TPA: immune inhibitor A domain-containing protein [Candidatus Limnocylindrales bacterium]|nr:immune inhibitor A domain-containing protein [Candidatus Limnocylindrales bacterium]
MKRLIIAISVAALAASAVGTTTAREPSKDAATSDYLPGRLAQDRTARKAEALSDVLSGQASAKGKNKVVKVAPGQFVELAFEGEDQILTLLGEFGPLPNNAHPGHPAHGGPAGPLHNEIPEPDRDEDNSTIWVDDFNQAHYDSLLYDKTRVPSMANWYLEQSSGTYSVDGYVSDWVQVPYNANAYGSNYCGSNVCTRDVGRFIEDQADTWWNVLVAEQGSAAAAEAFLATFDVWDRYDWNGNGNFDEADGYIDHFQSVHAGEGEETGGGAQGENAIWSHRSYVNSVPVGADGPVGFAPFGGARIGTSNYWIGDYTVEPENGGVGVFAHEYAHDLDIPDLYDGGGENSTGWWTVMSQGSYGSITGEDIGSHPTHFGAWEKIQLGFLKNYTTVQAGTSGTYHLGPAEFNSKKPQAMVIELPDNVVEHPVAGPYAGDWVYYSGSGADLDNNMTRPITLGAGPINLSFQGRWHIETCWDYAYVQVSTNGGTTWTNLNTSASTNLNESGQNEGNGITGVSGQPHVCDDLSGTPEWVNVTADLSAYANSTIQLRFRYWTDPFVNGLGLAADEIAITGLPTDGAETDPGWVYDGFSRIQAITDSFYNAYVLENRQYIGYDQALDLGPYNFGFPATPNLVEHFSLQDGLLISYWNEEWSDNNVSSHPGEGLILPVDSHPAIETWTNGDQMRPRIQSYDATFTKAATESITLHDPDTGVAKTISSKPGVSVFNDALRDGDGTSIYWAPGHPSDGTTSAGTAYQAEWNSVDVPNTGTRITVKSISGTGQLVLDLNK